MRFHKRKDGQVERTVHTLKDMLRSCVIISREIGMITFSHRVRYNNKFNSSIQMAPYETLYGCRCRSLVGWLEVGETTLIVPKLVYDSI